MPFCLRMKLEILVHPRSASFSTSSSRISRMRTCMAGHFFHTHSA